MWCYYFTFAISIVLAFVLGRKSVDHGVFRLKIDSPRQMAIVMFPIAFSFLFRWGVGVDANWYTGSYPQIYRELMRDPTLNYDAELVFSLITKTFCALRIPYFWWVFFLGAIYLYAIGKFIYVWSTNVPLSLFLFLVSDMYLVGFGALRQILAISFLLLGYCEIRENGHCVRKWKVVIYLLLATLSHTSGILGVFVFALAFVRIKFRNLIICMLGFTVASPITTVILRRVISLTVYGKKYADTIYSEGQSAETHIVLSFLILLVSILMHKLIMDENKQNVLWINTALAYYVLMLNSSALIQTFRIVYYFTPVVLILVPIITSVIRKVKTRLITVWAVVLVCTLMFVNSYHIGNGKLAFTPYRTVFSHPEFLYRS